jgi:hypothetical protein
MNANKILPAIPRQKVRECKDCKQAPRMGPLQSRCSKCVKTRLRAKEQAKKERLKIKRQKHKERPAALKKKLDIAFSKYIRKRDEGKPCITCLKPWDKNFQCGHLISRRHQSTKWDEYNANGQCPGCNMFEGGRQLEHAYATDKLYGAGTAECILRRSKDIFREDAEWIKDRIAYFEAKTQALEALPAVR